MKKNKFSLVLLLSLMGASLRAEQTDLPTDDLTDSISQAIDLQDKKLPEDNKILENNQEEAETNTNQISRPSLEEQPELQMFEKDIEAPQVINNTLSDEMKSTLSLDQKDAPEKEDSEKTQPEEIKSAESQPETEKTVTVVEHTPDISFLPQAKIYGGWEGIPADQKKEIKASDVWKELKADHKSATDPELYRLYIAETTTSQKADKTPVAPEKKSATDDKTKSTDSKHKATPEELYIHVLREAQPNASHAQFETALEEFRSAMAQYVKEFSHSDKVDEFSNNISVAPEKPVIKELVKEEKTEPAAQVEKAKPVVNTEQMTAPIQVEPVNPATEEKSLEPEVPAEKQPEEQKSLKEEKTENAPAAKELLEIEPAAPAPEVVLPMTPKDPVAPQSQEIKLPTDTTQKAEAPLLDLPEPQF